MRWHPDLVSGTVLLAVGVGYFVMARALPTTADGPGPAFLPIILSVGLILISSFMMIQAVREDPQVPGHDSASAPQAAIWTTILALLTGVYLLLFPLLGAVLSTWLYTFGVAYLFGARRAIPLILTPTLSTAAIYLVFEIGLGARLP